MGLSEDRLKAMEFRGPEAIPVNVGILPAAWMQYREKLDEVVGRHPALFGVSKGPRNYDEVWEEKYHAGKHVDAWGCVWENVHEGMAAMVKHHPVPTREAIRALQLPEKDEVFPHGFMYLRLCDLRGFEEAMLDFAEEPPELQQLIDLVLAYNLRQLDGTLAGLEAPELLVFGDDLGMQTSLPISPAKWRKYLKPCYAKLYGRVRAAGHWVYMHSDGHIFEIIPDLVECGVNVINPQVRANGLANLARVCKGKVCVDLDLDRQMFPFATPAELDAHVRECVETLGSPDGGLWLKAEIGPDVPLENIGALFTALETHRSFFRRS